MTIIGLDPHPDTHTAVALDSNGKTLDSLTLSNDEPGFQQLWRWARQFPERCWAIEGASNRFIVHWVAWLLAQGESVVNIAPALTSQYRSRRGKKKDDVIDAENAARALLANPELPLYQPGAEQAALQELSRNRDRLARQLKANRMAFQALTDNSLARATLATVISALKQAIQALEQELEKRVKVLVPELLEEQGVGVVLAGVILAEVGEVSRFANEDKFASYCGAAPVMKGSGRNMRAQVNPSGNRRLNRALHLIVQTRLRTDSGRSKALLTKKLQQGETQKQALRALKTYVARSLYRTLLVTRSCSSGFHSLAS